MQAQGTDPVLLQSTPELNSGREGSKIIIRTGIANGEPKATGEPVLDGEGVKTGVRTYAVEGCRNPRKLRRKADGYEVDRGFSAPK